MWRSHSMHSVTHIFFLTHNRILARSALECVSLATALDLGEPIESRTVLRRLHPPSVTPREKGYVSCNTNFAQIQSGRERRALQSAARLFTKLVA